MAFPKLHRDVRAHSAEIRAHFADSIQRPVLIVGNGPSAAEPFVERIPENPVIFRMNWFFLEDVCTYGRRVDGFFWSVNTPALQNELAAVIARREYEIDAFFSPMRAVRETNDGATLDERFRPDFDHWAVIAAEPVFAREFMGRPLPTQGFQVLAFALALGFREIHLSGIDLYASTTRRYGYQIPDRIARQLKPKDVNPGYEDAHTLDRDISFFQTCREQFPDANLYALSDSPFLREHLNPHERVSSYWSPGGADKLLQHSPGSLTFPDGSRARPSVDNVSRYAKVINGRKCAFVTLVAGGGFEHGAQALASSLRKVTDVPLVVMCVPETDKSMLFADNVVLYDVSPIGNPNELSADNERFRHTYTKLAAFGLTAWDRLVYLDADAIVLKNIDELFDVDEFAAAPDLGLELAYHRFNSGVFCCQPTDELLEDMLTRLRQLPSYDGGDQGFLNAYFEKPRLLDRNYNVLKRLYVHHPNLFRWEDVKVLHFVGRKPWQVVLGGDARYEELERLWFNHLSPEQLVALARECFAAQREPASGEKNGVRVTNGLVGRSTDAVFARKLRKLRRDPVRFFRDARILRPFTQPKD